MPRGSYFMHKTKLLFSSNLSSTNEVQSMSSQTSSFKSNDSHEHLEDYVVHQALNEPDSDHHQQTDTATTTTVTGNFLKNQQFQKFPLSFLSTFQTFSKKNMSRSFCLNDILNTFSKVHLLT